MTKEDSNLIDDYGFYLGDILQDCQPDASAEEFEQIIIRLEALIRLIKRQEKIGDDNPIIDSINTTIAGIHTYSQSQVETRNSLLNPARPWLYGLNEDSNENM